MELGCCCVRKKSRLLFSLIWAIHCYQMDRSSWFRVFSHKHFCLLQRINPAFKLLAASFGGLEIVLVLLLLRDLRALQCIFVLFLPYSARDWVFFCFFTNTVENTSIYLSILGIFVLSAAETKHQNLRFDRARSGISSVGSSTILVPDFNTYP